MLFLSMKKISFLIFTIISISSLMVYSNEVYAEIENDKGEYITKYLEKIETINARDDKPLPKHQIDMGVFHKDVICNNDLVLILKWSSNNVACVKQETAEKLIERQWGVISSLTHLDGTDISTCFPVWTVSYDELNQRSDSKIIKTVRSVLKEFYPEPWTVVDINVNSSLNNSISVSIDKCLSKDIEIKIAETLGSIEHVKKTEFLGTLLT